MEITYGEALAMASALDSVYTLKMKFPVAMQFRRLGRKLEPLIKDFEAERIKLIESLANRDDAGNIITRDDHGVDIGDNAAEFSERYAEMITEKIDIGVAPIKASELVRLEISPGTLAALGEAVEDDLA